MSSKLNIAIVGYGKMGKIIEEIAVNRGHKIALKITSKNAQDLPQLLQENKIHVAIEFSNPNSAYQNITTLLNNKIPTVIGTTGWYNRWDEVTALVKEKDTAILPATNFSLGVNIFFEINKRLATLMNPHSDYNVEIKEIHHTQKLDAPSGTAITTAEGILAELDRKKQWQLNETSSKEDLKITAERLPDVPGTHEVHYSSEIDTITLSHTAHNRNGFALGAVLAAEFIYNKKGIFSMPDVLDFKK